MTGGAVFVRLCWLLQVAAFAGRVQATYNFSPYPPCSQPLLYELAPASCDHGNYNSEEVHLSNQCLCNNDDFLQDTAQEIYAQCGCVVLKATAGMMHDFCTESGATVRYSVEQYVALGDQNEGNCVLETPGSSTAASPTSTSTSTSTSAPTDAEAHVPSSTSTAPSQASSSASAAAAAISNSWRQHNNDVAGLWRQGFKIALGVTIGFGVPVLMMNAH